MTTTADDVWKLLAELVEAQKETERCFQETERRFQEPDRQADRRIHAATADRIARVVAVVLLSTEVGDRGAADGDGQQARPADVGQRIGELAGAGRHACRGGQRGRSQQAQRREESVDDVHRTGTSSMRRRCPSCETIAGTAAIPNLRTRVPSWS